MNSIKKMLKKLLSKFFGIRLIRETTFVKLTDGGNPSHDDLEYNFIPLDYPIRPRYRDYQNTIGGRKILEFLDSHSDRYFQFLRDAATFMDEFSAISLKDSLSVVEPVWLNGWIPGLDSISIYTLIRTITPQVYFEVGSGNSTKFARRAIKDGRLKTRIVSVDPHPRAEIDQLCDEVIRKPFEDLKENDWMRYLSPGDVVFIDNSHRSFQSSDVTVFFTEMLPALPSNVVWGLHDIFLPVDYPEAWLDRFYNEQYLLAAYLLGGNSLDEIIFPAAFVSRSPKFKQTIAENFSKIKQAGVETYGGAFWMKRKTL